VLVTNDDGIDSPGLWALARAASQSARVTVVAPKFNQSAVGAGFTLRRELTWERVGDARVPGIDAWTVDGTPADCVAIAFDKICDGDVDLVFSGINQGANVGQDVLASGTVGGALAGSLRGKPALAFSQAMESPTSDFDWSTAERVAAHICEAEANGMLPMSIFLNVNVPACRWEEISGILVTRMGAHGYVRLLQASSQSAVLERQYDVHTNPDAPPGTDLWALANHYISVSPLQSNLTDHRLIDILGQRLNAAFRPATP
jgi:5'-nucleotidase